MAIFNKNDDIKKIINTKAPTKEEEVKTSGIVLLDKISDELIKHPDYHSQYSYTFSGGGKFIENINNLTDAGKQRNEFLKSDTDDLKRYRRRIPKDELAQSQADKKFEHTFHVRHEDESFRRQMNKDKNVAQFWIEPTNRLYVYDDDFEYMRTITFDDLQDECRKYLNRRIIEENGKAREQNLRNLVAATGLDEKDFYLYETNENGEKVPVEIEVGYDSMGKPIMRPELDSLKTEMAYMEYFDKVQEVFPDYASIKFERRTAGENYFFDYQPKMRLNGHDVKLNQMDRAFEQVQRTGDFERGDFEKGLLFAGEKGKAGAKYVAGYQVSRMGYDALSAPKKTKEQGEGLIMSILTKMLGNMRQGFSR